MKKRAIIMFVTALIMALGMSQSVMAKKIEYLGHYYNGKVNKQKIPEGEGGIAIADVAVFGTFNANNITNAKIETDWIKISGAISFDESDRITVKAGSNISSTVYLSSTIENILTENGLKPGSFGVNSHVFQKTLEKDSIVDLASTHADFYFSTKVYELAPNPPTIMSQVHAELVPIEISYDVKDLWGKKTGQTAKRQTKIYKIEKSIEEIEYRLDNYKDKYGRIWNVFGPIETNRGRCAGKVTYPNGDYIETDEYGNVKDFEVEKDGFVIKKELVIFSDSTKIYFNDDLSDKSNQFRRNLFQSEIGKARLRKISFSRSKLSKLSNKDISSLINEKVSQAFVDYSFVTFKVLEGDSEVGIYENGEYVSYKELNAEEDARNAKMNKSIANFKKKYGFDPSVDNASYVVKVGRNLIGVVDDRNEWITEYHKDLNRIGNTGIITVSLRNDQGSRKCFNFYYNGYYQGFIWVKNNIITSVSWK